MSDGLLNRTFQSACVPWMLLVHAMDPCPRPSVRLGRSPCAPIAGGDSSWEASAARSAAASVAVAADMSSLSSCSPRCASSRASAIRRGAKTGSDGVWAEGGERMRALPSREDTAMFKHWLFKHQLRPAPLRTLCGHGRCASYSRRVLRLSTAIAQPMQQSEERLSPLALAVRARVTASRG